MKERKEKIIVIYIGVVLSVIGILLFELYSKTILVKIDGQELKDYMSNENIVCEIETAKVGVNTISINGWCVEKNIPIKTYDVSILLDDNKGNIYEIRPQMIGRKEKEILYNAERKFVPSAGFRIKFFKYGMNGGIYNIKILCRNNGNKYMVSTNTKIEVKK